jgi:hypothetical protein
MPNMSGGGAITSDPTAPSLLQMATSGEGSIQDWAPSWVREQLPANLAYWAAQTGGDFGGGGGGGSGGAPDYSNAFAPIDNGDMILGSGAGKLAPWLNPANWGPPPAITEPLAASPRGYFPSQFAKGGSNPNDQVLDPEILAGGIQSGISRRRNCRARRAAQHPQLPANRGRSG